MTHGNRKPEHVPDPKEPGNVEPRKSKTKRASPRSQVNIELGDVSGISGKVNVAGGNIITSATPQEIDQEYELAEIAKLKQSLLKKRSSLDALSSAQPDHKFDGTPLDIGEGQYLVGRTEFVERLVQNVKHHHTVILSGATGIGKTSVIQAGLVPRLLSEHDLPILVDMNNPNVANAIKLEMMSGVQTTKYLWQQPLTKFLEDAAGCLAPGETLLVVLDGFEKISAVSSQCSNSGRIQTRLPAEKPGLFVYSE